MSDKKFDKFISLLERSKSTVALTGAGVSTFSGIPDFRSSDGIYSKQYKHLSVEEVISLPLFKRNPEIFYSWAKDEWYNLADFEPSIVHIALAKLEEAGKLDGLYTQNIDMLHTRAGSRKVYELHGSAAHHHCTSCRASYPFDEIYATVKSGSVPKCTKCGGVIKPDIIFYGENLDNSLLTRAYNAFSKADLAIALGTSLIVQPVASLVYTTISRGGELVIVNRQSTPYDRNATVRFDDLKEFSEALLAYLKAR